MKFATSSTAPCATDPVVDGEGGHLQRDGDDVDGGVEDVRLELLLQVREPALPAGTETDRSETPTRPRQNRH